MARETIDGVCETTLRAIADHCRTMVFDAVHFDIRDVRWNGKKTPFHYEKGKLTVTSKTAVASGTEVLISIRYRVTKPKMGATFIKPDRFYPQRPTQMWTQGEDEYARYWFPCHDAPHERTTTELIATVPFGFTAVSNGALRRSSHNRRQKISTFHWIQKIPHATYLVTLAIGKFSLIRDRYKKTPVLYYCEKGREADAKRAFGKTPDMIAFFSKHIGVPYPYPKYAQIAAVEFIYGGMENTSATTQTEYALLDARASLDTTSDELVAHELAHQWFGDYLTCKDWSHAWLNESFATYFEALYKQHNRGQDEYLYEMRGNADRYFDEDKEHYRRPISTKVFKRPSDLFDRHLYEKGALVLSMLHHQLGDSLFWKSINTYVRRNRARVVETGDFLKAIEEATGRNMDSFFDQWIYGAGHPELRIRAWWDRRKKEMIVRVVQSHAQGDGVGLFTLPTEFLFLTKQGSVRRPVKIDGKTHLFKFALPSEPTMTLFDPDHALLKKVDFQKSKTQWLAQLSKDKNPLGRIDAARAAARLGGKAVFEGLRRALLKDAFWGVRVECARALGSLRTEEAARLLLHCLDVIDHPKVRRALYEALRDFKSREVVMEIEKRFRGEASYFAEAEGLRAIGALNHPKAVSILQQALTKDSWNDVIRIAALEGFTALRSDEWIPLLVSYTRPGHHQRLRMAAVACLASMGAGSDEVHARLIELLNDSFLLVRIAAVRGLHRMGDERALSPLKKLTDGDLDGRLKRLAEEAVQKITKGFE